MWRHHAALAGVSSPASRRGSTYRHWRSLCLGAKGAGKKAGESTEDRVYNAYTMQCMVQNIVEHWHRKPMSVCGEFYVSWFSGMDHTVL